MSVLTNTKKGSINREFVSQPYRSTDNYQEQVVTDRTLEGALDPGVSGRLFSNMFDRITLEEWRHSSDPSKINGAKIFSKSITADSIAAKTITVGEIADGATTFTFFQSSIPTATSANDIWYDSDDGNKPYIATAKGDNQISAGEWVAVPDATITTAQTTADTAEANAQTGISNAATAQGLLDDIADDEKITPVEKLTIKPIWDDIIVEGTATTGTIPTQATLFSVADTDFDTAYATLYGYIITSLNTFGSMTTTTTITRATWDAAWEGYYTQRTQLLNAIAAAAKTLADTAESNAQTGISNAATAQGTAEGKINSFRQSGIPTAIAAGDIWIDSDDEKIYRATAAGDDAIGGGEWILQDPRIATGWSHGSDVTKIDGGNIYTNTVTATQINVSTLSALAADVGVLTAGIVADHATAASRKIELDLDNKWLKVWDDQATPQLRVQIGSLA